MLCKTIINFSEHKMSNLTIIYYIYYIYRIGPTFVWTPVKKKNKKKKKNPTSFYTCNYVP
jgi:hypothetical protein